MKFKKSVFHIEKLLTAPGLNLVTNRAFGLLLLLTNVFLPMGAHRKWMGWSGWWLFPIAAAIAMLGFWQTKIGGGIGWRYIALPYAFLYVLDAWALFMPEKQGEGTNA